MHAVKVSNDGLVYVADRPNRRVQVFTPEGKYITQTFINRSGPSPQSAAGLAFSPDTPQQFLYVADYGNSHIAVLDRKTLQLLYQFGQRSEKPGDFQGLHHLAIDSRVNLYTGEVDEHLRFLLLTRATIESCQRMGFAPQIFHCNDWHTAFAPLFLRSIYAWDRLFAKTRTVLTIHNIGYQGIFAASAASDLGLGASSHLLHQDDLRRGRINSLKHGILYADAVTTVSPTYAREIVDVWLTTAFEGGRHVRRLEQIGRIERGEEP